MTLADLKPAPYNPRQRLKPADKAYRKLKASLKEFGLVEPLIWNETTGHVVGGHARLRILKSLKVEEVTVSVVRLPIEREKALNVVLNNQEAQGKFDTDRLAELLTELEDLPEFALTGFEQSDLDHLMMQPVGEPDDVEEEDDLVSVTLEMDGATFEVVSERIERLVAEHDLVSHVKRHGG